ncbi:hypothetical protein, variant 1 [Aphanomyces invadans]|uniref:Uncharacterized protein n=2 Tax=Aphanomyces invadans TaxID=157072 RepID=A0A024TZW9_9STRA|nr:hypothetical protein, variant 1 [Aphanomyces invadans]ETV99191.1 hypothetical protein, variant 1 [Aphanomyces invadans]|eukprot:XP_008871747.1 hypothetical protein, variant 1 [Aphanomyces invadans]
MSAPLSIHDLSALKRQNKEIEEALTKAVSSLKDLGLHDEGIDRPFEFCKTTGSHRSLKHSAPVHDRRRSDEAQSAVMQMQAAQAMHEEYEALIADMSNEMKLLRMELSRKVASATKDTAAIVNLSAQLKASTVDLQARTTALTECMDRIQALETTVESQTRAILTKETELKQLEADLTDLRRQVRAAAAAADTQKGELVVLQRSLDGERSGRKKAEKRAADLDAKVKVLHGQCAVLEQTHATFAAVDAEHRKDMQLVVDQLEETKGMLSRVQVDMSNRIARRDTRISRLKMAVMDFQREKKQWQDQVDRFKKALEEAATADDRVHIERMTCKRLVQHCVHPLCVADASCRWTKQKLQLPRTPQGVFASKKKSRICAPNAL